MLAGGTIGGAGDLLGVVGGVMKPEEFCFLTASPVETVEVSWRTDAVVGCRVWSTR